MTPLTYNITQTQNDVLNPLALDQELRPVVPTLEGVSYTDGAATFAVKLTAAPDAPTTAAILAVINAHTGASQSLDGAKHDKVADIDRRTDELIAMGFEYPPTSGRRISLNIGTQVRILGVYALKDHAALVYPIVWNDLSDLDPYSVADAADLESFLLVAAGTLRAVIDSGTGLKDAVRAAGSVSDVLAVVDPR